MLLKPLQVFKPTKYSSKFDVSTGCDILKGELHVYFRIEGELSSICFSEADHPPRFANELWKKTCFEVFVSQAKKESYSEWNLSPDKDWAFYSFDSYRKPAVKPPVVLAPLEISTSKMENEYTLTARLPLEKARIKRNFDIGLTVVIQDRDNELSYWALFHLGSKPDFHKREAFSWRIVE